MVMVYKGHSDLVECQHTLQGHFQFVIVKCIEKSPTNLAEQIFAFFFILLRFGGKNFSSKMPFKCSKAPKKTNSLVIPTSTVIITAVCSA